jgi:hypothetical protein
MSDVPNFYEFLALLAGTAALCWFGSACGLRAAGDALGILAAGKLYARGIYRP